MKINPNFEKKWIFFGFLVGSFLFFGISFARNPLDRIREDGLPFKLSIEKETIGQILNLQTHKIQVPDIPGNTGFISLNKKSRGFRGQKIAIEGRLLRIEYLPLEENKGLYISWILLDDEKRIPIRLITQSIPSDFKPDPPDQQGFRKDRIRSIGIYYRLIPFTDGKNFYNTPTLISPTFSRIDSTSHPHLPLIPSGKKDSLSHDIVAPPQKDLSVCTHNFDLSDPERKDLLQFLYRLHGRSRITLDGIPIRGWLKEIRQIDLHPDEKRGTAFDTVYRCELMCEPSFSKEPLILYTTRIPSFQINAEGLSFTADPLSEKIFDPKKGKEERVGGTVFPLELSSKRKVNILSELEWYPKDHLPGKLGMNVASFDRVPVYPASALNTLQKIADPLRSEQIKRKKDSVLRALRFTEDDTDLFYGLLSVLKKTKINPLKEEARKNFSTVDLFNRPEQYQGQAFFIRGHVRRALYIPIVNKDQQKRWGLNGYYQLYLYTDDSQGYPLVLSVPELPEGMPVGSEREFREEVEIAAIFCKTWAYKIDKPIPDTQSALNHTEKKGEENWIRAPCLIGSDLRWIPDQKSSPDFSWKYFRYSFYVLIFLFFIYRLKKYFAFFFRGNRFKD